MKRWQQMTREQLQEAVDEDSVVVATIGATEQHGPHLPVNVDNEIINAVAMLSVTKASEHVPVILGPHIPFGYSPHHFQYAGVISLTVETMLSLIKDVLESVLKSGFQKIMLLNSHGGNGELIRIAVKELHEKYPSSSLIAASYWELAATSLLGLKEEIKLYDVGHAGQFETALMMAIKEESVHLDKLSLAKRGRNEEELLFPPFVQLSEGNIWKEMDGFSDNPALATKEIGNQLLNTITDDVSNVIKNMYHS